MRRYNTFFNKPGSQGTVKYFGTEMLFGSPRANIYLYKFFRDQGLSDDPMESVSQYRARCLSEFESYVKQHRSCYTILVTPTYAGWKQVHSVCAEKLAVDFMDRMRQAAAATNQTANFSEDHETVPGHISIFDANDDNKHGYLSHKNYLIKINEMQCKKTSLQPLAIKKYLLLVLTKSISLRISIWYAKKRIQSVMM